MAVSLISMMNVQAFLGYIKFSNIFLKRTMPFLGLNADVYVNVSILSLIC